MNQIFPVHCLQFFTATIYAWNHLLADDNYKNIIVDSLRFLVTDKRIELNAFVILSNPRLTGRAGYSFDLPTGRSGNHWLALLLQISRHHYNPVKAGLCEKPEDYYYSSARSDSYRIYLDGWDSFKMLTHYTGN